ncbi:MAG: hypothetical protein ACYCX6_06410 [Vulcanimicrobiaceae bacterium]
MRYRVLAPSADAPPELAAATAQLETLEALVATMERCLLARDWASLEIAMADSRRVTHALQNAMEEARDARDESFDLGVYERLLFVHGARQNQMARIRQYRDSVGERLTLIARWKDAARTIGGERRRSTLGTLDRMS